MTFIRDTKTRLIAIVAGVTAILAWLANFRIPTERIQFVTYALGRLWPELLVIVALVYLSISFRHWRDKTKQTYAYVVDLNERTDGLVRKVMIGSLAIAICVFLLWAPKIYVQAIESADRRLRMYGYVFSGNYINHLHQNASKELAKGSPSTAARFLATASAWPATSDSVKARYAGYKDIAKSRDTLAGQFYDTFRKHSRPVTNVTGTAYITGATALDRSTPLYADAARLRLQLLRQFKQAVSAAFESCGVSDPGRRGDPAGGEACRHLVAQTFGAEVRDCAEAARAYCEIFSLTHAPKDVRSRHFAAFYDRSTGLADLDSVVNSELPEWYPGYNADFYESE